MVNDILIMKFVIKNRRVTFLCLLLFDVKIIRRLKLNEMTTTINLNEFTYCSIQPQIMVDNHKLFK